MKNSSTRWLAQGAIVALVGGAGALVWNVSAYYVGAVGTRAAYTRVFPTLLLLGPAVALAAAFFLWDSNIPKRSSGSAPSPPGARTGRRMRRTR